MKHRPTTVENAPSRRKVTLPEMLTETLRDETRHDYRWCSAVKSLARLASGLGIALLILFAAAWSSSAAVPLQSILLLTSLALVSVGFYSSEAFYDRKRKQSRLINKLQNHAVAVGPALLLMHHEQEHEVLDAAAQMLKSHLPMLREQDDLVMTASQRAALCYLVQSIDNDGELAMAAIRALRFVGDETAVAPLQALLSSRTSTEETRAAVDECLRMIALRSVARTHARTLLRAGTSDESVRSSLLRSSSKDLETRPEQLLRAIK